MRNQLKYIWTAALCLAISYSYGQKDPAAQALLDKSYARYEAAHSILARWDMTIELPEQSDEHQSGILRTQGDYSMMESDSYGFYNDGETVYVHMKELGEVQILDPEQAAEEGGLPDLEEIVGMYRSGDWDYVLLPTDGDPQIELKPIRNDGDYFKVRIVIDRGTSLPKLMKFFNRDGSNFILRIKDIQLDTPIDPSDLQWDASKYPDVFVEDMRY